MTGDGGNVSPSARSRAASAGSAVTEVQMACFHCPFELVAILRSHRPARPVEKALCERFSVWPSADYRAPVAAVINCSCKENPGRIRRTSIWIAVEVSHPAAVLMLNLESTRAKDVTRQFVPTPKGIIRLPEGRSDKILHLELKVPE